MVAGLWGRKLGMTQVFSDTAKVVPVTVIDLGNWLVVGFKTQERDGYNAIKVGCLRDRYAGQEFSSSWLKKLKQYFSAVREIRCAELPEDVTVGQQVSTQDILEAGKCIDVFGVTKGCGFAGVVRRHNFAGGRGSHGDKMGRAPGAISFMRATGRVPKGKKLPGHMGAVKRRICNLEVVRVEPEQKVVLVKGAVPGKAGSLVYLQKR